MLKAFTRWLPCVTVALLAGAAAAYAQNQPKLDFGTSLKDGLAKEESRHRSVTTRIQKERLDADAQRRMAYNHCTPTSSQGARAAEQCRERADVAYQQSMQKINDERIQEEALNGKNRLDIEQKWYDSQGCTGGNCK
jgi:hypothetical protein